MSTLYSDNRFSIYLPLTHNKKSDCYQRLEGLYVIDYIIYSNAFQTLCCDTLVH